MIPNVLGPCVERVLREQRQQDVEVEADRREDGHHRERHLHRQVVARVREPFACAAEDRRPAPSFERIELGDAHREQRAEHGEEARGVDREAPAGADHGDHDAGDRRAEDAREVEEARVERDRVRQLVLADHLERQVLARRCVEHDRCPRERGDRVDLPQLDVPEQRECREHRGEHHLHGLRHDHRAAVVEPVGDDAREQAEEREGAEPADGEQADGEAARVRGLSSMTTQASPMFCIQVPATEVSWPKKKSR